MSESLLSAAQIDHVEVFVPDRPAAAAWYARVLGLAPVPAWTRWATGRGPLMLSADGGETMVALFERRPCPARGAGEHHRLAFRVGGPAFVAFVHGAAVGPVYDEAGTELPGLTPVDHDGAYSVYFCDPWGNRIEVTTYDVGYVARHGDPAWRGPSSG